MFNNFLISDHHDINTRRSQLPEIDLYRVMQRTIVDEKKKCELEASRRLNIPEIRKDSIVTRPPFDGYYPTF